MQEVTVPVGSIPQVAPPTAIGGRKNGFALNGTLFLLVLVGLHLWFRVMGWIGDLAIVIILPVGYAAYYFVRAVLLLDLISR